ncbi:M48 family metallopeptidase [Actinoplanes oblitus]|uniref:M48 family metallopeptidase n=1 Tax=Actinoplanes oblitus TaxID=3040509 RepID=A0ABY8WU44_9ACTN|nr:M48 family metallopeptidase [Actinoplanes oblitus]WIN00699.1 M48 family metallopeptidase [Actinoplanes oblitus]
MVSVVTSCPKCTAATISKRSAEPWCPACEWNLDRFEADRAPELGWRWLDRRLFGAAYRLTERQFAELKGAPRAGRPASAARIATIALSVVLLAAVAALLVTGVWLATYDFFAPINLIGALLVLIAVALRPRLGRLSRLTAGRQELDRSTAPALFAVIERVAAAVGAPMPDVVLLSADRNAFTTTVGLRRRRVLCLGAPLWAVLDPQERVALLGHELGHFVNGDVRRGMVTQAAVTTLGQVAYLLAPRGRRSGFVEMVVDLLARTAARLFLVLHLVLVWISMRDSQRAEYRADEMAARAGGSDAAIRLSDQFLFDDAIDTVVRREARAGNGAAAWRTAADEARTGLSVDVSAFRQLSRRTEASLFASHPPAGLRAGLIAARAAQPAAVVLTEPERARMDDELAAHYERVRRELAAAVW